MIVISNQQGARSATEASGELRIKPRPASLRMAPFNGIPTYSQQVALALIPKFAAGVSIVGSSYIVRQSWPKLGEKRAGGGTATQPAASRPILASFGAGNRPLRARTGSCQMIAQLPTRGLHVALSMGQPFSH